MTKKLLITMPDNIYDKFKNDLYMNSEYGSVARGLPEELLMMILASIEMGNNELNIKEDKICRKKS